MPTHPVSNSAQSSSRAPHRSSRESSRARRHRNRRLSLGIWGVQAVLSAIFLMQGLLKLLMPVETLGLTMPWVSLAPGWLVAGIGLMELAVSALMIVPALLRYRPELGIYAGWTLASFMCIAILFHLINGEYAAIPYNLLVLLLAGFVIWGRMYQDPIQPKDASGTVSPATNRKLQ